jgi:rod shape-determining protein MreD
MPGKVVLILAAIVVVVLSLQTTVLDGLSIFGAKLDLLLAIVVYTSLTKGPVAGVLTGFILGLLQDAQSQHGLGLDALSKAAVGYAAQFTWEGLDKESVYTQMAVLLVAGLLHNLIFLFLYCGSQLTMVPGLWLRVGVPGALYTAVVAPLLVALLSKLTGFRMEFSAASIRKR